MEIVNIIKEHIKWRQQIFKLAMSDMKKTYNGAALGWSWAIIRPTVTIFVYWFAFSMGLRAKSGVGGVPFFFWLLSGIIPWFYVRDMWSGGPNIMRKYRFLITKMKFPVSTIPTFCNLSKLYVHILLVVIVIAIFGLGGFMPDMYYLQIPFYMIMMFIFFNFWALMSSVMGAMSKDFANLVSSFTLAIFWLSGIMIPLNRIHSHWAKLVLELNPVTYIVEGYRNCFIGKVWFWQEPRLLLIFLVEMCVLSLMAVISFKNLKKDMPDVL